MAYTRVNWEDRPSTNTPINATNLNKMDKGIKDLEDSLATVATTGDYDDLTDTPNLATVATSGSYSDLSNKPTIPDELADLSDDATHRLVTDTEKSTWNGKQDKVTAKGSTTKPVYTSADGTFAECSTYAGGTAVTLNGSNKAGSTASMYAPTSAGTSGQVLKSNGSGAPSWVNQSSLIADTYSTSETRIGTWIDGSPLYRIVVQTTVPTAINTWQIVKTISGLKDFIDVRGYRIVSDGEIAPIIPIYDVFWNRSAGFLSMKASSDYDKNRTKYVIITYTKNS